MAEGLPGHEVGAAPEVGAAGAGGAVGGFRGQTGAASEPPRMGPGYGERGAGRRTQGAGV